MSDLISRQAAVEKIQRRIEMALYDVAKYGKSEYAERAVQVREGLAIARSIIEALPAAEGVSHAE